MEICTRSSLLTIRRPRRLSPPSGSKRIDEFQSGKVLFIVGNNDTAVCLSYRGDNHVKRTPRPPPGRTFGHQLRPDEGRLFVEGEDAAREKCLRPFRTRE